MLALAFYLVGSMRLLHDVLLRFPCGVQYGPTNGKHSARFSEVWTTRDPYFEVCVFS